MDIAVRMLNGLLMIAMPIALGIYLARRTGQRWKLFLVGAVLFVGGWAMAQLWQELAGADTGRISHFDDALELSFYVIRGMALQKILKDDDTERRRLYEIWKRLVADALKEESLWASSS